MPEIRCARNMMRAVIYKPSVFITKEAAIMSYIVPYMKLLGGFLSEIANILLIIESPEIQEVVKDFISLLIIAEIDNIMLASVNINVEQEMNSV